MPTYSAGSASVQIVPDFSNAQRRIGEWFSRQGNMRVKVEPEADRSGLQRMTREIENHKATTKVDVDFKDAGQKVLKFLDTMTGFSLVEKQFERMFGPGSILKTSGVGAILSLGSAAGQVLPILGLLPAAIMGAAGPLAALAVGAHGVMGAFKALGAADTASAATGQSAAAARVSAAKQIEAAQKGVESAERGVETARRGIASADRTLADAERAVGDAEKGVAKAQAETKQAQADLNAARAEAVRNLQDMNMELARASLNEEAANLSVEEAKNKLDQALAGDAAAAKLRLDATSALNKAQADLARTMQDPLATQADQAAATQAVADAHSHLTDTVAQTTSAQSLNAREADLGYRQAKENLAEIQVRNKRLATDTAKANKEGVEGQSNVIAAHDKVASAVDNQSKAARTLSDAHRSVGDAHVGVADAARNLSDANRSLAEANRSLAEAQTAAATSGDKASTAQNKAAEAMAKLAPNARDFVLKVRALSGAWKDLTHAVQQNLFAGIGDSVTKLANAQLPTLKAGLSGIAHELNTGFRASMDVFSKPEAVKDFATTLGNVQKMWHGIAQAAAPFTKAFINLTTVGSQFLPQFGTWIANMATKFSDFIQDARDSGKLAQWFQTAITTIKQLGTIIGNVAGGLKGIFTAALPSGEQALTLLTNLTGFLKTFLNSTEGQDSLAQFFGQTMDAISALQPAFEALTESAVTGLLPAMSGLAKEIAPVVNDVLVQFADVVGKLAPLIYPVLADAISTALAALAPLVDVFGAIVEAVLPSVVDLVNKIAPIFTTLAEGIGKLLVKAVQDLAPLLPPLVDAVVALADNFTTWGLGVVDLALNMLPPLVLVLTGLLKVVQLLAPIIPPLVTAWLAFKAVAILETIFEAVGTALMAVGVAAERLGAAKLSNALGDAANGASRAGSAMRGATGAFIAVGAVFGIIAMAAQRNKERVDEWSKSMVEGGSKAAAAMKDAANPSLWDKFTYNLGHWFNTTSVGTAQVRELKKAVREQWAAMSPLEQANQKVAYWQNEINYRMGKFGKNSPEVQAAVQRLAVWTGRAKVQQQGMAEATQTATEKLQAQQDQIKGSVDSQLALERSQLATKSAMETYNATMADGKKTADEKKQAELDLRQAMLDEADAAKKKAEQDASGKTAAEKAKAGSDAYITTLEKLSNNLTGPAKKAMDQMIADLKKTKDDSGLTSQALGDLGITVDNMPDGHHIVIDAPTADQKKRLEDLGFTVKELPNGKVEVVANTKPAQDAINHMLSQKWTAYIDAQPAFSIARADAVQNAFRALGGAIGGIVHKFASGGFEYMKGGIAQVVPPNTWRVIGDRVADDEAYIPINTAPRSQEILSITAERMGYGLVPNAIGNYIASSRYMQPMVNGAEVLANADSIVTSSKALAMKTLQVEALLRLKQVMDATGVLGGGGTVGSGSSIWERMFNTVKAAIPQARINSAYRPGSPDYHGIGRAVDFGFGTGPGGNGSAGLASISRWIYDHWGAKTAELIYDGLGDDRPDIKNGANHTYSPSLRAQHHNHVHWAMDSFGYKTPTFDRGGYLPPGISTVLNATGRPEPVLTAAEHDSLLRWRSVVGAKSGEPQTVAGFVNNGTVLTTDLPELARKARIGTARALTAAGL